MNAKNKFRTNLLVLVAFLVVLGSTITLQTSDKIKEIFTGVKVPKKLETHYERDSLRAFYTAPPVIPHEVYNPIKSSECLHCHKEFRELGDRVAVKTPHAGLSNCMQCHVASDTSKYKNFEPAKNQFVGLTEPKDGIKGHEFAPPMMPHRTFLREDCKTCHSPKHPNQSMRSQHVERENCLQCHAPLKENEF